MTATLYCGDAIEVLQTLPAESVQCCVTSPPYWGLRDYGVSGQLGLERTPEEYVAKMVSVFQEARRALREDGTLWLNMGDSYAADRGGTSMPAETLAGGEHGRGEPKHRRGRSEKYEPRRDARCYGLKHKDLVGIPWRLAFALQADGWWLRSDIIWSKPNPMPESVTDRPTKAHEYVFLLSKSANYYYDAAAIRRPMAETSISRLAQDVEHQTGSQRANGGAKTNGNMKAVRRSDKQRGHSRRHAGFNDRWDQMTREEQMEGGANARTVWEIATQPYAQAHFATFPEELARRCIVAGSRPGDCVLDPFGGSGTVAQVATGNGRDSIYIDLNPKYVELAKQRIGPMLCEVA